MKDSVKVNMIVFFIIAIIAFGISTAFANLTINEEQESYRLIPIENDSFEPEYINKVPTIIPKTETKNTTNTTNTTIENVINQTIETIDETYNEINKTYHEYVE